MRVLLLRRKRSTFSSWPGLTRPSKSFSGVGKAWMPGTSPGMTG